MRASRSAIGTADWEGQRDLLPAQRTRRRGVSMTSPRGSTRRWTFGADVGVDSEARPCPFREAHLHPLLKMIAGRAWVLGLGARTDTLAFCLEFHAAADQINTLRRVDPCTGKSAIPSALALGGLRSSQRPDMGNGAPIRNTRIIWRLRAQSGVLSHGLVWAPDRNLNRVPDTFSFPRLFWRSAGLRC